MNPKISIIMPVFNAEASLGSTISHLKNQTLQDFEVVFVDDESADNSLSVLQRAAEQDQRIIVLHQPHSGAGAARNLGLACAKGEYVIFSDCDDLYTAHMLETLYTSAKANSADITACNYTGMDSKGKLYHQKGILESLLPKDCNIINRKNCPKHILRVMGIHVWNKLYCRSFLLENNLKFDVLSTCNTLSFVAVSMALAERITYVQDHLIAYRFPRLGNTKAATDLVSAIHSTMTQMDDLNDKAELIKAIARFGIDHYLEALKKYIKDFASPDAAYLYREAHQLFNTEPFLAVTLPDLGNGELYREFCTVQKHDYEAMCLLQSRRIIVSMTSYPKRIPTVHKALESIYAQTKSADLVVLWLAEEQFPNKEHDLPETLMKLVREKGLLIRWCDDLKGHKKYFYALQEFKNDIVITSDDDLLYPADMIESLHKSYLLFPNAISTMRTHLILLSEDNQILPYHDWIRETDGTMHQPSMQLMASGGAGDLYPPALFKQEFFDKDLVINRCLWADNLYVKIMELVSDVPVVLAHKIDPLRYVEDTQGETLFQINGELNQYDSQLADMITWVDAMFGPNILQNKLLSPNIGQHFCTTQEISRHINTERKIKRTALKNLEESLALMKLENCKLQSKLEQAHTDIAKAQRRSLEAETLAKKYHDEKMHTEEALCREQNNKAIGKQLKALGAQLRQQKSAGVKHLYFKFLLYYLAWIPEKILVGMMHLISHGFIATIKMRRK